MLEAFTLDLATGFVFAVLTFFSAYSCTVMFQAFKLPADAS
jgi:hypothetical protein